jgi:hypothetical protein
MPDQMADGAGVLDDAIVEARGEKDGRRADRMDVGRANEEKAEAYGSREMVGAGLAARDAREEVEARRERKSGAIRGMADTIRVSIVCLRR